MVLYRTILILGLLALSLSQNAPCYVRCKENSCPASDLLACTDCDPGSVVVNNKCTPIGGQTRPIEYLKPINQNELRNDFFNTYKSSVRCQYNDEGNLTFVDTTISTTDIYVVETIQVPLYTEHSYIQVKFNSILFNQNPNPSIRVLIIDQNGRNLYDQSLRPTTDQSLTCYLRDDFTQNSSPPIDVRLKFVSNSKTIYIQSGTTSAGDLLGISNFEIYAGNCHTSCATCNGPTSQECVSCSGFLTLTANNVCEGCPDSFTQVEDLCFVCPPQCTNCTYNSRSGQVECIACNPKITNDTECKINYLYYTQATDLEFNQSNYQVFDSSKSNATSGQKITKFSWQSDQVNENIITRCGPYSLIGGISVGLARSTFKKTFQNLLAHQTIWLKFTLVLIDRISNSRYTCNIKVDGEEFVRTIEIDQSLQNSDICAGPDQEYVEQIFIQQIAHEEQNVTIEIQGLSNFFGFRDFTLGVRNLTDNPICKYANADGVCQVCNAGYDAQTSCQQCPAGQAITNLDVRQQNQEGPQMCAPCSLLCSTCEQTSAKNPVNRCQACDSPLIYDDDTKQCVDKENSIYDVEISPYTDTVVDNSWTFYPKLQSKKLDKCGDNYILGSSRLQYRNLTMKRELKNLPPHKGVILYFFFYQIDDYDGINNNKSQYTATFKINDKEYPYEVSKSGYQICGNSSFDSVKKIVLEDPNHSSDTLKFEVFGNRVKFGINSFTVFLENCGKCENGIGHKLELLPIYSIDAQPRKGMYAKILFDTYTNVIEQKNSDFSVKQLYGLQFVDKKKVLSQEANNSKGLNLQPRQTDFSEAEMFKGRELRLFRPLTENKIDKGIIAKVLSFDKAFSNIPEEDRKLTLRNDPIKEEFPRYDDITEDQTGYRTDIRNLMNFLRGISILAMFIGLISFFFKLSHLFDDLFILCQVIFAHIFIQSPWLAATFKLPVSGMHIVQFMAWLPMPARKSIQNSIYNRKDYYQRSPIVYEQFWEDINFIRTIYHTLIFLGAMLVFFFIVRFIKNLVRPRLYMIMDSNHHPPKLIERYFFSLVNRTFSFIDRVIRFTFFTVVWAANLQFIYFDCEPLEISVASSVVCIIMFVLYLLYVIIGQVYFFKQSTTLNDHSFLEKHGAIRINKYRTWYFAWQYVKLLIIATLIAQLYNSNPLAVLIPLIFIFAIDALIIIFRNPFLINLKDQARIQSKCSKLYWKSYQITAIIQNVLFIILEIILIIMYATRNTADTPTYLNIGYAATAFVIMLLVNGLVRLAWGMVSFFEVCIDDVHKQNEEIRSEHDIKPLAALIALKNEYMDEINEQENDNILRNEQRRPSIDNRI